MATPEKTPDTEKQKGFDVEDLGGELFTLFKEHVSKDDKASGCGGTRVPIPLAEKQKLKEESQARLDELIDKAADALIKTEGNKKVIDVIDLVFHNSIFRHPGKDWLIEVYQKLAVRVAEKASGKEPQELPTQRGKIQKVLDKKEESRELTPEQQEAFLSTLETRFSQKPDHYERSRGIKFDEVKTALEANPALMYSLAKMEETGGEPDIIAVEGDLFIFADYSAESPSGRRHLTYDEAAEMAKEFGVDMMTENVYRKIQETGKFDRDTWSLLATPADVRETGSALDGNRDGDGVNVNRYGGTRVSYGNRGWRGVLRVPKAA
ncbi:MAG TPA: DUF4256 family protein [Candidatus Peregrinibacteria bacterium]|nr:DUF4256 family protein [Candidatus Peregrinibacteria bacterium]